MPRIIVIVSPTGETTVKGVGYKGTACKDATKAIEKALGKTTSDVKHPEWFQQNHNQARQA